MSVIALKCVKVIVAYIIQGQYKILSKETTVKDVYHAVPHNNWICLSAELTLVSVSYSCVKARQLTQMGTEQ